MSQAFVPRRGGRLFAHFLAALASLLLCAWVPKSQHPNVRSIGIIAAVGDTCAFEHVPDRSFEWIGPPRTSFLEISDWGIDDAVTQTVASVLSPTYLTQTIAIEHQDFDTWTYDTLVRDIRELPVPETPVDAYLLILRDWRGDDIGRSDHPLVGLGLYRRDANGKARYGVFAAWRLILMEPEKGGIIASREAVLPNGRLPWLPASRLLWSPTQNDVTDRQRLTLRRDFLKLIAASLPGALRDLGLQTNAY